MSTQSTLDRLDDLIQSHSILDHPFYKAWKCGELTRDQLSTYAAIYYPHVEAFPKHLESAIGSTDDDMIRGELQDNLQDELTNPKAHPEMWLDFAEAFDVDRADVAGANPHPAAERIIDTFERLAGEGIASALAGLYAYESQQPDVSLEKAKGLQEFYGVEDPKTLAYFDVHAEADLEHRAGERRAIERCLEEGAVEGEILAAAEQALDAYWGLLDGVCEETGISLN